MLLLLLLVVVMMLLLLLKMTMTLIWGPCQRRLWSERNCHSENAGGGRMSVSKRLQQMHWSMNARGVLLMLLLMLMLLVVLVPKARVRRRVVSAGA